MNERERRLKMVLDQLESRDITDKRVLEVMRNMPRHLFVPKAYAEDAYADCPLPIGESQTISQPYIVAYMTQALALKGEEIVLEIGCGSGYQAAILAQLSNKVYSIERFPSLADVARKAIVSLGIDNVEIILGDGSIGLPQYAPFQAIIVTAAAPQVPQALLEQLTQDGRLVIPVGRRWEQVLQLWTKKDNEFQPKNMLPVAFVPLRGQQGWSDKEWHAD